MEQVKVLPFGARVRLSSVDLFGHCGRELHPTSEDIGFLGVVTENVVDTYTGDGGVLKVRENAPPGTVLRQDADFGDHEHTIFEEACYTVVAPDGRKLECMGFELELIGSVVCG